MVTAMNRSGSLQLWRMTAYGVVSKMAVEEELNHGLLGLAAMDQALGLLLSLPQLPLPASELLDQAFSLQRASGEPPARIHRSQAPRLPYLPL